MTRPLSFTEASIRRRIKAAQKEGLHVLGIGPDGTVILGEKANPPLSDLGADPDNADSTSKWEDVEA